MHLLQPLAELEPVHDELYRNVGASSDANIATKCFINAFPLSVPDEVVQGLRVHSDEMLARNCLFGIVML